MSRYTCHACRTEHEIDNMCAYCAACFSDEKQARQETERKLELYTKTIDAEKSLLKAEVESLIKGEAHLEGYLAKAEARVRELEKENAELRKKILV